jgi:hypothetical protein
MPNTTNYSFPTPADTDLVKNGADAIRDLGDAVDTAMNTALGTKKAGMVLLNTTSFSAVATQSVNNVFTSTYDNYKLVINIKNTNAGTILIKFRAAGADNSTSNYYFTSQTINGGTWADMGNANADPSAILFNNDTNESNVSTDIYRPALAFKTSFVSTGHNGRQGTYGAGVFDTTAQFDGFTIIRGTGTMTGTLRVYGYNN